MALAATAQAMPGSASTWRRAAISSQWCTIIVLIRYDALRPQRLAAPVKVYVEQFSAHPLESDKDALAGHRRLRAERSTSAFCSIWRRIGSCMGARCLSECAEKVRRWRSMCG